MPAKRLQATRQPARGKPTGRAVAITFDDVPLQYELLEPARLEVIHERLLASLAAHKVPAIGFVNEKSLYTNGDTESRIDILRMWLDAGLELGNHTFSHLYFYETPLEVFQKDVIRGASVTEALLKERARRLRYFRYPFLCTGPELDTKTAFESFLAEHGYQPAPVSLDNVDWLFARSYACAVQRKQQKVAQRIAALYVPYMEEVFAFFEQLSTDLLGYEVRQILGLHTSMLTAVMFDELACMIKRRGYKFITLQQALADPAYQLPDTYVGPVGISWLQRWALTKGLPYRKEPAPPPYIRRFDNQAESGTDYKTA